MDKNRRLDNSRASLCGVLQRRIRLVRYLQVFFWAIVASFFLLATPVQNLGWPRAFINAFAIFHGATFLCLLGAIRVVNSTYVDIITEARNRNDSSRMGDLLEILHDRNIINRFENEEIHLVEETLKEFLLRSPEEVESLTIRQRAYIPHALTRSNAGLVLSMLRVVPRIANAEISERVKALASGSWIARDNLEVRHSAEECAAILARMRSETIQQETLLRASVPDPSSLLRPARAVDAASHSVEELVRPVSDTVGPSNTDSAPTVLS